MEIEAASLSPVSFHRPCGSGRGVSGGARAVRSRAEEGVQVVVQDGGAVEAVALVVVAEVAGRSLAAVATPGVVILGERLGHEAGGAGD